MCFICLRLHVLLPSVSLASLCMSKYPPYALTFCPNPDYKSSVLMGRCHICVLHDFSHTVIVPGVWYEFIK